MDIHCCSVNTVRILRPCKVVNEYINVILYTLNTSGICLQILHDLCTVLGLWEPQDGLKMLSKHIASRYKSANNPVVKVEGRRPKTLTTGLFVLSIPGMAT